MNLYISLWWKWEYLNIKEISKYLSTYFTWAQEQIVRQNNRICYVYIDTTTIHSNENKKRQKKKTKISIYKTIWSKTFLNKRTNFTHEKSVSDEHIYFRPSTRRNRTLLRLVYSMGILFFLFIFFLFVDIFVIIEKEIVFGMKFHTLKTECLIIDSYFFPVQQNSNQLNFTVCVLFCRLTVTSAITCIKLNQTEQLAAVLSSVIMLYCKS